MSDTVDPPFFSGWIGFGGGAGPGDFAEPTDPSYQRRPILYGPLVGRLAPDISGGSIGPVAVAWPPLLVAGLFDQQAGGDLIAWWTLPRPITVAIGATLTTADAYSLTLTSAPPAPDAPLVWWAGTLLGHVDGGSGVLAAQNLEVSGGTLSILPGGGGSGISVSSLPTVAPAPGSGVLWNNGGVICVA